MARVVVKSCAALARELGTALAEQEIAQLLHQAPISLFVIGTAKPSIGQNKLPQVAAEGW